MDFPDVESTDDMMCLSHITDPYLLAKVEGYAENDGECFVCRDNHLVQQGEVVNLGPVAELALDGIRRMFDQDGFVIDGRQVATEYDTAEAVGAVLDQAIEEEALDLVVGYASLIIKTEPYWYTEFFDPNDDREYEWHMFEQSVKHETRLLTPAPDGERPKTAPERNHAFIKSLLVWADQFSIDLEAGTDLYRARIERDSRSLRQTIESSPASQLGPAPADQAAAGRMNAQGIPMFYVALDADTACAEVAAHSPYNEAVVGKFELQAPLRILDLTQVPPIQSVFNDEINEGNYRTEAMSFYVDQITRPVIIDGKHPVDYAASQLLTEAFRWWTMPPLDGIMYPSRVSDGGKNLVLFFSDDLWIDPVGYNDAVGIRLRDRESNRQHTEPLFVIDPASIKTQRMKRSITVENL